MENQDIRWIQRFNNWTNALEQLTKFIDTEQLDELQKQGLIKSFEYNHELAWKTQKDFLEAQGVIDLFGAKNVAQEAFNKGLIQDGDVWIQMIKDRNLSVHTYNQDVAQKIVDNIINDYYHAFMALHKRLNDLKPSNE